LEIDDRVVETLLLCRHELGGFSGGTGQMAHLATSYAAIHAIAILGPEAYHIIDRYCLFLLDLRYTDF
jgi:protein farnesyltransferase subunit beta